MLLRTEGDSDVLATGALSPLFDLDDESDDDDDILSEHSLSFDRIRFSLDCFIPISNNDTIYSREKHFELYRYVFLHLIRDSNREFLEQSLVL
jgi:hypothetical protein